LNVQVSLKNEAVAPWKEVSCCEACWMAREDRCVCKCGGLYHGFGNPDNEEKVEKRRRIRKHIQEKCAHYQAYPSAQRYKKLITDPHCHCGYDLSDELVLAYSHPSGWEIEESNELQWLWITCPNCGYDMSLWKLGVPRDANILVEAS